jgi:hypothetical protein
MLTVLTACVVLVVAVGVFGWFRVCEALGDYGARLAQLERKTELMPAKPVYPSNVFDSYRKLREVELTVVETQLTDEGTRYVLTDGTDTFLLTL